MAKRDALRGFVFYTQDYFGDREVRLMPGHLRIVWVEAFLLMSDSPRRGVLLKKSGDPYSVTDLAKLMNVPVEDVESAFAWVIREGIADVDRLTKTLVCRKMVRDEIRRKTGSKFGRKGGGNPNLRVLISDSQGESNPATFIGNSKGDLYTTEPDPDPKLSNTDLSLVSNSSLKPNNSLKLGKTARKTRAPAVLEITDGMRRWASENQILVNLEAETAAMLDYHRGKGNLQLDWTATWRTWMRNTKKFSRNNGTAPARESIDWDSPEMQEAERRHREIYGDKLK